MIKKLLDSWPTAPSSQRQMKQKQEVVITQKKTSHATRGMVEDNQSRDPRRSSPAINDSISNRMPEKEKENNAVGATAQRRGNFRNYMTSNVKIINRITSLGTGLFIVYQF